MLLCGRPLLFALQLLYCLVPFCPLILLCLLCYLVFDSPFHCYLIFLCPFCCLFHCPFCCPIFLCLLCHLVFLYPLWRRFFLCQLCYLFLCLLYCFALYPLCCLFLYPLYYLVLDSVQLWFVLYLQFLKHLNKLCQMSVWATNQPAPALQNFFVHFWFLAHYPKK